MGTGRASRAPRLGLTRRGGHRPGSCHGHGATDAQASTLELEPTSQGPPSSAWPPASAASRGLGSPRGQITDARLHRGLTAGAPSAPSPLSALPRPAGAQGTASSAVSCACGNGSFLPRGACHCVSLQKCMLPCGGITHHVHTVTCQADPTAMCNRKKRVSGLTLDPLFLTKTPMDYRQVGHSVRSPLSEPFLHSHLLTHLHGKDFRALETWEGGVSSGGQGRDSACLGGGCRWQDGG